MAALAETGFAAEVPEDLLAWARVDEPRIMLFSVLEPEDWDLLPQLCQARKGVAVLAVLEEESIVAYVRALVAGAVGAVPRQVSPEAMCEVFQAAVRGDSLLPVPVVQALVHRSTDETQSPGNEGPTLQERDWLRQLASGSSVARLADQAGYSERMMFRLLRDLYTRVGAANRTEALIRARDERWI